MLGGMPSIHGRKVSDRIRLAWIAGVVNRCAAWTVPIGEALADAVAELHEVATDHTGTLRKDLLGQQAGLHQGLALGNDGSDRQGHEAKAALLAVAGADRDVAAVWVPIGVERAKRKAAPLTSR